jgi:hypothetical protein
MPKVHVEDRFKNEIIHLTVKKKLSCFGVLDCKKHFDAEGEPQI